MIIKVCGLARPDNLSAALKLPVDMVGLIFAAKSPRYVGANGAVKKWIELNEAQFGGIQRVGVFVNAEMDYVLNTVHDFRLDTVQLHGDESPGYCRELALLWSVSTLPKADISKAFRITPDFDFSRTEAFAPTCTHFVFDTGGLAAPGGTGKQWDWSLLERYTGTTPFLLSGGIGPADVERIRALRHPQLLGVDVNSGFEIEPGVKNIELLGSFIESLRA